MGCFEWLLRGPRGAPIYLLGAPISFVWLVPSLQRKSKSWTSAWPEPRLSAASFSTLLKQVLPGNLSRGFYPDLKRVSGYNQVLPGNGRLGMNSVSGNAAAPLPEGTNAAPKVVRPPARALRLNWELPSWSTSFRAN